MFKTCIARILWALILASLLIFNENKIHTTHQTNQSKKKTNADQTKTKIMMMRKSVLEHLKNLPGFQHRPIHPHDSIAAELQRT